MKSRFDTVAKIDTDYIGGTPLGGEFGVTAFAAAALEHDLILKKILFNGLEPAKELLVVLWVFLGEICPLPAEILGRRGLIFLDLCEIDETRNAANDLVLTVAFLACQNALDDLFVVVFACVRQ